MIMYRLQMTFLKNKYLLLLLFGLEERLFVPLFVSLCLPRPSAHHRKYGENPANLGRNRLLKGSRKVRGAGECPRGGLCVGGVKSGENKLIQPYLCSFLTGFFVLIFLPPAITPGENAMTFPRRF